ncbi:MAG TPA: ankyrin repeat domain-containing protein [Candidatus Babeliaceae bacterium]|nr:ankyrin repeat domain-containing protein [Candidatus Babeliaceae bacterium]
MCVKVRLLIIMLALSQYLSSEEKALFEAIDCGDEAKVFSILTLVEEIDINSRNSQQETPLLFAVRVDSKSQLKIIAYLLFFGADLTISDAQGYTPLHRAASLITEDTGERLTLLLYAGADCNSCTNIEGLTPLMVALKAGNEAALRVLLGQPGIDLGLQDNNGNTVLHWAFMLGNYEAIKLLERYGASYNSVNKLGQTPKDVIQLDSPEQFRRRSDRSSLKLKDLLYSKLISLCS